MTKRRALLMMGSASAALAALSACGLTDPRVRGQAGRAGSPTPAPTVPATQLQAVADERSLAAAVMAYAATPGTTPATAAIARDWSAACLVHTVALRRVDPLQGPPPAPEAETGSPSPTPVAQALSQLKAEASRVSTAHLALATTAERADLALLWGSLAVAAAASGELVRVAPTPTLPAPLDLRTPADALMVLLGQLYRGEYALNAILGSTPAGSPQQLLTTRRDQLSQWRATTEERIRTELKLTPPPPTTGYQLPARPNGRNTALIMGAVETDLMNACARVFATAPATRRERDFGPWTTQRQAVSSWTTITAWPGWVF